MPSRQTKAKQQSQDYRRVKSMIARCRWLSGWAELKDDRVVFFSEDGEQTELAAPLIAQTRRTLNKVKKHARIARSIVGDLDGWLSRQEDSLEAAKSLSGSLERLSQNGNGLAGTGADYAADSTDALRDYIVMDAWCINDFSEHIHRGVRALQKKAESELDQLIRDYREPERVRSVAALHLGAMDTGRVNRLPQRSRSAKVKDSAISDSIRRCYRWGQQNGYSKHAGIVASALAEGASLQPVNHLVDSISSASLSLVGSYTMKSLIRRGLPVSAIIKLNKDAAALKSNLNKLSDLRRLQQPGKKMSKDWLEQRKSNLNQSVARLEETIRSWLTTSTSTELCLDLVELIEMIQKQPVDHASLAKEICYLLEVGRKLPGEQREAFIKIVRKNPLRFWARKVDKKTSVRILKRRGVNYGHQESFLGALAVFLAKSRSPVLARKAVEQGILSELVRFGIFDPSMGENAIACCALLDLGKMKYPVQRFIELMSKLGTVEKTEKYLDPLVSALTEIPADERYHYAEICSEIHLNSLDWPEGLLRIASILPRLHAAAKNDKSDGCIHNCMIYSAARMRSNFDEVSEVLIDVYSNEHPLSYHQINALRQGVRVAMELIETIYRDHFPSALLQARGIDTSPTGIFERLLSHSVAKDTHWDYRGIMALTIEHLRKYPEFTGLLIGQLQTGNSRTTKLIEKLAIISRFGSPADDEIKKLRRFDQFRNDSRLASRLAGKGWKGVIELQPGLVPYIFSYVCCKSITGESQSPPRSIEKTMDSIHRLDTERRHLIRLLDKGHPESKHLRTRLATLEARLSSKHNSKSHIKKRLSKQMVHITRECELDLLEHILNRCFSRHLGRLTGDVEKRAAIDSYLLNALLLTQDITINKRLLKKLIRLHVNDETHWREKLPANARFLDQLRESGTDPDVWLASHAVKFEADAIPGGSIIIRLECDPIKILEMGNYFDTCLSFGGCSSFSTVANACDLNKRVLYVEDRRGLIVGRKLIGLNEKGKLIGYRTYTSLDDSKARTQLRQLVTRHIRYFARLCNLALSTAGTVPSLVTPHWYDDGTVKWSADLQAPVKSRPVEAS